MGKGIASAALDTTEEPVDHRYLALWGAVGTLVALGLGAGVAGAFCGLLSWPALLLGWFAVNAGVVLITLLAQHGPAAGRRVGPAPVAFQAPRRGHA